MQNLSSKIVAILISMLMIISIGAAITQLPDAKAQRANQFSNR